MFPAIAGQAVKWSLKPGRRHSRKIENSPNDFTRVAAASNLEQKNKKRSETETVLSFPPGRGRPTYRCAASAEFALFKLFISAIHRPDMCKSKSTSEQDQT